jgi:glycosyltransferase involved in cell wall biosynthesis
MRWVILTDDCVPMTGGVATWTALVRAEMDRRGFDVKVYARQRDGLRAVQGVKGPSFGQWGGLWLAGAAAGDLHRADAILATTWPVATWVRRWPSWARRLHVVMHGSDVTMAARSHRSRLAVLRSAAHVWSVSEYLRARVRPWGVDPLVLPAPVVPTTAGASSGALQRALCVCRGVPRKGGDRFVRLVAAAGLEGTLVGGGPEVARWKSLADELGARVHFKGELGRDEVAQAFQSTDVVVLLPRANTDGSGAEGLGMVLLEAAAHGVPAVGCAIGGVPEAVGPLGCLLSDPDDPVGSARHLQAWWTADKGRQARAWLGQRHGVTRLVDQLVGGVGP